MASSSIEKSPEDTTIRPTFSKENINSNEILATVRSIDGKVVEVTGNVDEAMKYALDLEDVDIDDEKFKKLLRKIDFHLLPLICLLYALQFMDKTSSSYAAVMGLRTYYKMEGVMYSWVGSSFYLGYLAFEFPVSALLQRFPVAKTASAFVIIWGVLLCLHATPSTYPGLITLRTLLGIFESGITPAMVIITGQWYKKEEQFLRTSLWFSCNGLGTIMGSAIAYGLATHESSYSMPAWKILFIVVGVMTIFVGILILIWIPDLPTKAIWLTEEEKRLTVLRIKTNQQGFGNKHFKFSQFKEALLDINTWLFFFFALASNIPNGSLTNFGSILLTETFGYTATESLYMNMPTGAVELVGCILLAWLHRYCSSRLIISFISMAIALVCACMLAFAKHSPHARLAGYYLMFVYPLTTICSLSCFSSNVAGHTKKITVNAIYLIGYCAGNLIGPQTFIASQAPEYVGGEIAIVVCYVVSLIFIAWTYFNYWRVNRQRNRLQAEGKLEIPDFENYEFADLTDKENPNFRYSL
ncbi:allantoate permease [Martiniozyma asiatica (nom. inval.)]|nr:allantoate permease [Martiniozyma asiatica]